jgi:hypothetical protein
VLVQLVVSYFDGQTRYFPVSADRSWHIDTMNRCLVIGRKMPHTYIPFDRVECWHVEQYDSTRDAD